MFYVASTLGCYWIAIDCLLMDVVFEGWLACHQAGLGNTLGLVAGDAAVVAWRVQSHRERWLDGCRVLSSLGGLYLSQQVRGHIARAAGIGSDDVSKTRIELHSRHVVIHEHDAEHLGSITFTTQQRIPRTACVHDGSGCSHGGWHWSRDCYLGFVRQSCMERKTVATVNGSVYDRVYISRRLAESH